MKTRFRLPLLALALASAAPAATLSTSATAPVVDDADLANQSTPSGTDKWWVSTGADGRARGQSFKTGPGALRLKAITYQTTSGSVPTKSFTIRVGKLAGTVLTPVHSETATQTAGWSAGDHVTWTFANPPLLDGNTVYGVDVGMTGSTTDWPTGIPYLNLTDDEFPGGVRYTSGAGTAGVGTGTASLTTGDFVFHLDLETPLGGPFGFVAGSPPDDASGVIIGQEIVATFSRNLTAGSGNVVIKNLTDGTESSLPIGQAPVSIAGNLLKIQVPGLLEYDRSYAIRIDAGALLDEGGNPFGGIADDTTWNFTTAVTDSFLDAVNALKNHLNGSAPLDSAQIAAIFDTIVANKLRFGESSTTITAVFNLVAAWETAKGAGFLQNTGINFSNRTTQAKTADWTVYQVMQTIVDQIYVPPVLAQHQSLINGFKLGVSAHFPGSCPPPAPGLTRTVSINASFPVTFGRETLMWTVAARKPTGTYLAPGTIATVTVPPSLVNAGYKIRVGCHSWDLENRRTQVRRLDRATVLYPITSTTVTVASPYGGGIYIEVPYQADAGIVPVSVSGAVRSPYFSLKSFHTTTPAEWLVERTHTAPWADFQTEKYMTQVPRKWIYNVSDPTAAMQGWDAAMDAINDLMGFPRNRGKETMYCQPDIILRSSVHAPGYPAVNVLTNPNSEVSPAGNANNYLVRGPNGAGTTASHIEFHEQGHGYLFPKFGGESESNVNLLQPAMLNRAFGVSFDTAHRSSLGSGNTFQTIDNTAVAWMCVFSFSPNEIPMQQLEKQYQLKGHAKWMDIARIYATPAHPDAGWEMLDAYWRSYQEDEAANLPVSESTDALLLRLCRAVGKDIRPLFHFWGIHPQNPSALAASLAAENIPADPAIKAKLLHYKSLVPANNAAFQAFAMSWWGRKPTVAGAWEETDHAMQWDETLDADGSNNPNVRPNGSIYVEASAAQIRDRVDELVALYFPAGITPATMSFAVEPTPLNATTIAMTAVTATAASPPVQYYFENTTNATNSGWISSTIWQQAGLAPGTYSYRVKARDSFNVENDWSPAEAVTLTSAGDVLPPAPDPMSFAIAPAALDEQGITMTATTASDVNGVEYQFENLTLATISGWQDSPVYTEINLQPLTSYTYRVRARDKSPNQNLTAFSATATASTSDLPDGIPPVFTALSPADGSLVSNLSANLSATFDENIIAGSGTITLKNLTDATETVFNIGDPAVTISGNTLTLNPPADLVPGKDYALQISSGAVADLFTNPFAGILDDTTWAFTTILEDPVANPGGPYLVPPGGALGLNGSASLPSHLQTIVSYEWDLDNDGTYGDLTGSEPAAIGEEILTTTWGMTIGQNTIRLRVTDSAAKTSSATASVRIGLTLAWDANGTAANHGDGGGTWLNAGQWREDGANTSWTTGAAAVFGNGGTGGTVTLGSATSAASMAFNSFTGTYSISGAGALTLVNGLTNNSASGAVSISAPVVLGSPQTWSGSSTGALTLSGGINTGGHTLTLGMPGTTTISAGTATITGSGGLTKNGSGRLVLGGGSPVPAHDYSGPTVLNGGVTMISNNNLGPGNLTLNGGVIESYWATNFTRNLGNNPGQMQITGGESGFSCNGATGLSVIIGNNANNEAVWGAPHFNPSVFILQTQYSQGTSGITFANKIDLGGTVRTIQVGGGTTGAASATLSGVVRSATGGGGLIKTGTGRLNLNAANTYNGGTILEAGTLQLGNAAGLGAAGSPLTVNGGTLNLNDQNTTVGNLSGTGGTIANNASNARTLTIGSGNATGGVFAGVIANKTGTGTGSLALTKTGSGTLTLAGSNSYTGTTAIHGGTLVLTGATQATMAITFTNDASLGLVAGSPVTAATAAVNFANGKIAVTGTPAGPSVPLLTALSFTGTPVLASAIPGYELEVSGNQLLLIQVATDPFATWSGGDAFDADANGDGIDNGLAWLLGAPDKNAAASHLLPSFDSTTDPAWFIFTFRRADAADLDPGTTVAVEYSNGLSGWTTAVDDDDIDIIETDNYHAASPGVDRVEVKFKRSAFGSGGRFFARLKVLKAP